MNILITGAGSGIGKATADYFLSLGHRVYGIDIKYTDVKDGLIPLCADITNSEQVCSIKERLSDDGVCLDAIINIAGIHKMASLVETDYPQLKRLIDINLCGTMLICNTFHSLLSEKGRIIIVTSEVAYLDPMPFNGLYSVSKTALDCYAQALRQELNLLNKKVITIRPGAIKTPLCTGSLTDTELLASNTELYKNQAGRFLGLTKKFMGKPIEPIKLARLIYKVAVKRNPRLIYKRHRNFGLVMLNLLPKRLQCAIIKLLLNKK
ncbi:MAG: SDR family NAD(P)-dependent oxidoreductase [Clostridia bacterium]|nr:SDR family NAD(P)-dependent oxidoreductase [Clostridia bacterium]